MATYNLGGRNPTLYSLFETKENIQLCGTQTKLSKQRYLAAWDFSTQLCAIEHPGTAPCFFPSDFSLAPGRRLPESIITISDQCLSFVFHNEYHKQLVLNLEMMQEIDPHSIKRYQTILHKYHSPVKSTRLSAPAANIQSQSELGSRQDSQPSRLETMVSKSGNKRVTWQEDIPLKPSNGGKLRTYGCIWMGLRSRNTERDVKEEERMEFKKSDDGECDGDGEETPLDLPGKSPKRTLMKNIDWLRRSFVRNCMGHRGEIVINASRWPNAEDTFIKRLTGEFYELEKLILDFLDIL